MVEKSVLEALFKNIIGKLELALLLLSDKTGRGQCMATKHYRDKEDIKE